MFQIVILFSLLSTLAQAATPREIAEWAIRWEGRVTLEGNRQRVTDVSQLPADGFEIVGIDLTGAVMRPAELEKLSGLVTLRELYLPGPIWNPGGGNEDANEVFKIIGSLKHLQKLYVGWHYSASINIRDTGMKNLTG